jgi:glutaminyl-peptide cyclotransferase
MNNSRTRVFIALGLIAVLAIVTFVWASRTFFESKEFEGEEALKHVEAQMAYGPRPPGSDALRQTGDYILAELTERNWIAESQEFTHNDVVLRNIIGKTSVGQGPVIIIGAHYDTRWFADQDPADKNLPVPGANDGASGAAILLELARTLDKGALRHEVWLVFFDGEDNGGINGWDWIVGSTYMANNLVVMPERMILLDMIGDADQQVYYDGSSDRAFSEELFTLADELGYGEYFIPEIKYSMHDDHIPFMQKGIPAVDLIDFDYPYWHTAADTTDKVSAESLERAGRLVEVYLEGRP